MNNTSYRSVNICLFKIDAFSWLISLILCENDSAAPRPACLVLEVPGNPLRLRMRPGKSELKSKMHLEQHSNNKTPVMVTLEKHNNLHSQLPPRIAKTSSLKCCSSIKSSFSALVFIEEPFRVLLSWRQKQEMAFFQLMVESFSERKVNNLAVLNSIPS